MIPETSSAAPGLPRWLMVAGPLVLLAALMFLIVNTAPAERLKSPGAPPVERLSIVRSTLGPEGIVLSVLNDGPDPITIAQVDG